MSDVTTQTVTPKKVTLSKEERKFFAHKVRKNLSKHLEIGHVRGDENGYQMSRDSKFADQNSFWMKFPYKEVFNKAEKFLKENHYLIDLDAKELKITVFYKAPEVVKEEIEKKEEIVDKWDKITERLERLNLRIQVTPEIQHSLAVAVYVDLAKMGLTIVSINDPFIMNGRSIEPKSLPKKDFIDYIAPTIKVV